LAALACALPAAAAAAAPGGGESAAIAAEAALPDPCIAALVRFHQAWTRGGKACLAYSEIAEELPAAVEQPSIDCWRAERCFSHEEIDALCDYLWRDSGADLTNPKTVAELAAARAYKHEELQRELDRCDAIKDALPGFREAERRMREAQAAQDQALEEACATAPTTSAGAIGLAGFLGNMLLGDLYPFEEPDAVRAGLKSLAAYIHSLKPADSRLTGLITGLWWAESMKASRHVFVRHGRTGADLDDFGPRRDRDRGDDTDEFFEEIYRQIDAAMTPGLVVAC
jgi:hypothetical protein